MDYLEKKELTDQVLSLEWTTEAVGRLSEEDKKLFDEAMDKILQAEVIYEKGSLTETEVIIELVEEVMSVADEYPPNIGELSLGVFMYTMYRNRFYKHKSH